MTLALSATGLVGCSATSTEATSTTPSGAASGSAAPGDDDVLVIQPGAPGEPDATGDALRPPAPAAWNATDAGFVQMMVPHHSQALETSALARTRARDPQVRALAERIDTAQLPEIQLMTAWMEEQGVAPMDGMDGMDGMEDMSAMEGMLSPEQMEELAAARGARFDRLFLRGMIAHHEGAVSMADDVAVGASALQVAELAADVASGQSGEVARMRDLLRSR